MQGEAEQRKAGGPDAVRHLHEGLLPQMAGEASELSAVASELVSTPAVIMHCDLSDPSYRGGN